MAWRRIYLLLALVRLYFALSPSYIHPDEHFQGPEVVAGDVFNWTITKTWEFTSSNPIRSSVPLWLTYALPMEFLKWAGGGEQPGPTLVFYILRLLFFFGSFVFEVWAFHELFPSKLPAALLLTSSSYVTWTYQSHTFSNSVETVLVLWSLVLIQRILGTKEKDGATGSMSGNCGLLAIVVVFGTFNRITFPAWLVLPGLKLMPLVASRPTAILGLLLPAVATTLLIILADTQYYHPNDDSFNPVFTPFNNFLYNSRSENLALHGTHAFYTHALINLPQLLGPAILLLPSCRYTFTSPSFLSAVSGILLLSIFPHQEARFLIPAVPLLLSSVQLPVGRKRRGVWITLWVVFNIIYAVLMGIFHQGGVVPAQLFLAENLPRENVVWWKTYPPPTWLLANNGTINTIDLMGAPYEKLEEVVAGMHACEMEKKNYVVAPLSAVRLDEMVESGDLHLVWKFDRHLNLDDMDFGDDGVWGTLERVIGRRGIGIFAVWAKC